MSNYAAPGEEARHNLGYWRGEEYVGVGCGAYGMTRIAGQPGEAGEARAVRERNVIEPGAYVEATREGLHAIVTTREPLDAEALLRERIMLGLRVAEGFDAERATRELGVPVWTREREREAEKLEARGRITRDGGCVRVPRAAWLWTDDTAARLF